MKMNSNIISAVVIAVGLAVGGIFVGETLLGTDDPPEYITFTSPVIVLNEDKQVPIGGLLEIGGGEETCNVSGEVLHTTTFQSFQQVEEDGTLLANVVGAAVFLFDLPEDCTPARAQIPLPPDVTLGFWVRIANTQFDVGGKPALPIEHTTEVFEVIP
jgi:hypothetical protein